MVTTPATLNVHYFYDYVYFSTTYHKSIIVS